MKISRSEEEGERNAWVVLAVAVVVVLV